MSNVSFLKIKIVFFTHYLNLHGANRSLLNLLNGLKSYGISPMVIAPQGKGELIAELHENNIPFIQLPLFYSYGRTKKDRIKRLFYNLVSIIRLRIRLSPADIHLVYSNSSVIAAGFWFSRLVGKPHIWHIREFGNLDYQLTPDWGNFVQKWMLQKSSAIIAVSNAVKNEVLSNIKNVKVIYNGVVSQIEIQEIEKVRNYISEQENNQFIFLIMGQINQSKMQEVAILAFSQIESSFPHARLWVAGRGPVAFIQQLKKLTVQLKIQDKVIFYGYVTKPFELFVQCNVTLMCSKYEAMGRVTAESMICGKPVIGNSSGGTPELIRNNVNGLLYEKSSQALAEKMAFCLNNSNWMKDASVNAREFALANFTEERYSGQVWEVIQSTIHGSTKKTC